MRCVWSRPRTGTRHYQSRTSVTKHKRFIILGKKQTIDPADSEDWDVPLFIFYVRIYLWLLFIY
jgi:hypothetical protein